MGYYCHSRGGACEFSSAQSACGMENWDQLSLLEQLGLMEHPGLFFSPEGF